jgi:hypothetical protein
MKKKIIMFAIALFMFIPIAKASNVTIDQIISKINERAADSNSFISKAGTNIVATKYDNTTIKISLTTDKTELCNIMLQDPSILNKPESCENMIFNAFIMYEYNNSILTYAEDYGYINSSNASIYYRDNEKDFIGELLAPQDSEVMEEMLYIAYNVQTGRSYNDIKDYLFHSGLVSLNGGLSFPLNTPEEISITKDGNGWITNYSVSLDKINIPETTNNNESNNNQSNNETDTTDNKAAHAYATDDNNFAISFIEEFNKEFRLSVQTYSELLKNVEEDELETVNEIFKKIKEQIKDNGEYIELYDIMVVNKANNEQKREGKFEFRIKLTDEMKKYNTFELVNIDDNYKKQDVVKMKIDGDYLVGELPHLSTYVLVGKKTENPKTGINKYIIPGSILLISTFGIYALYKKKTEI